MKIEVRQLMDENEMLSHIFLGCIPKEKLMDIKEKYIGKNGEEIDWQKESVKIPVEMKIGGVSLNPKEFFNSWRDQMQRMILEKAQELVSEKLGSQKMRDMQYKLDEYENILKSWEADINWDVKNPLVEGVKMKSYNEIQEQLEKLEKTLVRLESEIKEAGTTTPLAKNIEREYKIIESDIKTLKWILS